MAAPATFEATPLPRVAEPQPDNTASMTPPASADGEKAPNGMSPQLSELDLNHDRDHDHSHLTGGMQGATERAAEAEPIRPDHYYGGGKIPVFKPTMDQFRDFAAFIQNVDGYGMKSGVIKVIPPKEWRDSLPELEQAIKTIRVKNPIMQEFHGSHGTYTQANIEKQRSYNLPQWKALCDESSHQPPARRGERRRNQERANRPGPVPKSQTRSESQKQKTSLSKQPTIKEEPSDDPSESHQDKSKPQGPPTPVSPEPKPVETKSEELSDGESLPAPKPKGRQPKSVSARRKYNRGDAADFIDEEAFKDFDYHIHNSDEYTPERCDELETAYWKSLMYNNPMYGADMPGSLFDDSVTSWNVAKLPNLLDILGQKVPGVNTAYLYLGMWKATFAWHLEDVDLYSINYIHFGAPKQWYSISQEDLPKFEAAMKSIWPTDAKNCNQFLRHKTYLISPSLLKSQFGITVNRMVHHEGEFVITYPYGYHSGYNLGYNCAESVNFATEKWLDYARVAKKCNCESDSVWIDIAEIERKLRGESTPEYYDDLSDSEQIDGASDLLTPPRSVPERTAIRVKKRKRDGMEPRAKRVKLVERPRRIPCVLCPNDLDYEELLPAEDGKSQAHRRCATYIEETTILKDDAGREVVCDIDKIPKARMGLKCLFCREVRGACFQCMYGKCTRAYHPTCALLAGVQVEFGKVAVIADDSCEYYVPSVDLKCKYHRPKRLSSTDSPDFDPNLTETARKLQSGDLVQFQADKEINGAVVLENRPVERSLLLKVLPRGDVIELPYRWILFVKKSSFLPIDPTTKLLPAHFARKPESRKDMASSLPSHGTPFGDAQSTFQWAEFSSARPPINPCTKPVDLTKPNHIWYYLGESSTECRAQYTETPERPVHNPKSHFLESVRSINAPTMTSHPSYLINHAPKHHTLHRPPTAPSHPHLIPPRAHHHAPAQVAKSEPTHAQSEANNSKFPILTAGDRASQLMMARRLVASITDHANICAGYTIVPSDFVVQTLLGQAGIDVPRNGMEKLKTAMSESTVQKKTSEGAIVTQPLDIHAAEVDHLLRMLRFAIIHLTAPKPEILEKKPVEQTIKEPLKESHALPNVAGKWSYLDIQRRQTAAVYQSPYAPGFGFSDYAVKEYGLTGEQLSLSTLPAKGSLAKDFFDKLSPEDKERILHVCGDVLNGPKEPPPLTVLDPIMDIDHEPHFDPPVSTSMDNILPVDDHHLSAFDMNMTLRPDSPASSFGRPALRFQSPQDFSFHVDSHESSFPPRNLHMHDHHDLFGDPQANQRFWQRSALWTEGYTPSHEGDRPFFGPHERPTGNDYAASDMDVGRGPGSLHSMDMAGFGFDGPDETFPENNSPKDQ